MRGYLQHFLVPAVVVVVLQLLRRYCKPPAIPESGAEEPPSLETLDCQFRTTQWGVGALLVVVCIAFAMVSRSVFRSASTWMASLDGPAVITLYPSEAVWLFFPGFGALTTGWLIVELLLPLVLGKKTARIYLYWSNAKAGFNASKTFQWAAIGFAAPIGILTILALPVHTVFRDDVMAFRSFASLRAQEYRYDQIQTLTTTDGYRNRLGEFVSDPCILIDFNDGTRWSSGDLLRDPDDGIDLALKSFLAERSGVEFQHVPLVKDLSTR